MPSLIEPYMEMQIGLAMLQDASTANFAFIFSLDGNTEVALWVRRSVLSANSDRFRTVHNFPVNNGDPHVDYALNFPLVAYCALVRYMYTNDAEVNMDLNTFCLSDWPIRPPNAPESVALTTLRTRPMPRASWSDLHALAQRYEMHELREFCARRRDN